jgi:hypothetical protein
MTPAIVSPTNVTVTGITILFTLSDGTVRLAKMNEKQAHKASGLITHKVFGGRLKLSAQPVSQVQAKAPEPAKPSGIIIP